ncbi:MAG: GGDEF domain-containing protein [Candidatus Electrothrix sp. ATG2]|nr:GGDEF domain-containing protein [Candidatus Electrothrix sp. ATG2]
MQSMEEVLQGVERILHCFDLPFRLGERRLKVTASIGIAFGPDDDDNISELLRRADTAMYHAKTTSLNRYSLFHDTMKEKVARRLLIDECMYGALEHGEFEVHYQPKIAFSTRKIMGFEALIRWHSDKLGPVSPNEFIMIAEHNGLIVDIGKFVLEQALQVLSLWQKTTKIPLNMAVNLSPVQFRDADLVDFITQTIAQSGISNNSVELEITEGVLMSGRRNVKESLHQLKELGVRIALDDFGTGYASLSYLRNYPFDILKIDREFIKEITADNSDRKLAQATIAMANSLGLKVVAEGVEFEEQFAILSGYGCNYAQGFLFGKPVSADETTVLLKKI